MKEINYIQVVVMGLFVVLALIEIVAHIIKGNWLTVLIFGSLAVVVLLAAKYIIKEIKEDEN